MFKLFIPDSEKSAGSIRNTFINHHSRTKQDYSEERKVRDLNAITHQRDSGADPTKILQRKFYTTNILIGS